MLMIQYLRCYLAGPKRLGWQLSLQERETQGGRTQNDQHHGRQVQSAIGKWLIHRARRKTVIRFWDTISFKMVPNMRSS